MQVPQTDLSSLIAAAEALRIKGLAVPDFIATAAATTTTTPVPAAAARPAATTTEGELVPGWFGFPSMPPFPHSLHSFPLKQAKSWSQ